MKITPLEAWIARKIGHSGQRLDRKMLTDYQVARLHATLAWARENSPFYRQHLVDLPATVTGLEQLPFTTTDDIRSSPLQCLCVSQDDIRRVVTLDSSGTTGKPKRLYFTSEDQALTIDFFQVGMSTFTEAGDRVLILLPGETPGSVGDLLALALGRLGASAVKHGPVRDAAATLDIIRREQINVLVGIPTQALLLARHPVHPPPLLKSVLLTTDHVPDAIKHAVENAWGCTVYNHYGMTEMGLGGGVECEARRGYHLREADLLFEIVDPVSGHALPDGQEGEIVFTTLTRRGMPLIRYRTGDAGRIIPGDCPCGTCLKTLEKVTHRIQGCIQIGRHHLTMADLDEIIFAVESVTNFVAAVTHDKGRDCLQLAIQANNPDAVHAVRLALPAAPDFDIQVEAVDTIVSRTAKRFLVDQRQRV